MWVGKWIIRKLLQCEFKSKIEQKPKTGIDSFDPSKIKKTKRKKQVNKGFCLKLQKESQRTYHREGRVEMVTIHTSLLCHVIIFFSVV